jgi:hypothetical protein
MKYLTEPNYQDARTRWGLSTQYSVTKRFATYGAMTDLNGGFNPTNLVYGPGTPAYAICFIHSPSGASVIPAMLICRGAIHMNTRRCTPAFVSNSSRRINRGSGLRATS